MENNNQTNIDWNNAPEDLKVDFQLWLDASKVYYLLDSDDLLDDSEDSELLLDDLEFDELTRSLTERLVNYPDQLAIVTKSITKVIPDSEGQVQKFEHHEMISLFKIQWESRASMQDILKFFERNISILNNSYVGPKLDGHAIQVKLDLNDKNNKKIIQITTRGGQDVTEYLKDLSDIQSLLNYDYPTVNGELVLPKDIFNKKWSYEVLGEKAGYSNPRSAVGGVMKKDANDLRFIPLTDGVSPLVKNEFFKIWYKVEELLSSGSFESFFQHYKRDDYPFQIDGLVIGYPSDKRIIKDNYPMNLVSIKFPAPTAKTKIIGMTWSQKKSGNLTPVYDVEPVQLDGVIVRNVNAYNYGKIKELNCGIGSEIIITKSNDIIPIVKKVLTRSNQIKMPSVDYRVNGKHLVALDMEASKEYKFILGLKLLNIEGIGETIAEQIGNIIAYDIIEVFNPDHKPKILELMGMGKNFEKFCVVYQTRNIPLDQLIEMLQFDRCGKVSSKKFAEILTGKKVDTKGIDKTVLINVCKGEGFRKIQASMVRLKEFGISVIKPVEINDDTITFEMTGSPSNMTKKEFVEKMKLKFPNSAHTTLNKNTTYLFVDSMSSASSKMNKARKYGIKIMTYDDILK